MYNPKFQSAFQQGTLNIKKFFNKEHPKQPTNTNQQQKTIMLLPHQKGTTNQKHGNRLLNIFIQHMFICTNQKKMQQSMNYTSIFISISSYPSDEQA
eukprot:TRINITY_DN2707_c0_g1_i5.p3 TRINITY_DN2707_c0_g1~~TRINITY_DN2707_c0_g1_i5.p3  ORF type:complete len:111 (-),score=3.82 TRINITY_DN2707_c0_g1_i5:367-657(-)